MTADNLFLYGTLLSGTGDRAVDAIVARFCQPIHSGTIRARLYDLGAYPGAVPATAARDRVHGRVFRLSQPARSLALLDRYEGMRRDGSGAYVRRRATVTLDDGEGTLRAWVYFYARAVSRARRIAHGDYLRHRFGAV